MCVKGFWTIENTFSAAECEALAAELMTAEIGRSRAGARHLMSQPAIQRLAGDERLLRIARQALAPTATPYRATLFEKSGASNWLVVWHQDTALPLAARFDLPDWGPWSTKCGVHYAHAPTWALEQILALRLHLDDSTAENGPLLVIPHSQRLGVLADDEVFRVAHGQPPEACLVSRGGVLAMRPLLIHSSPKAAASTPRRVLHLEYAASLDLAPGIRLAVA
jgi:Phytanoyl-CoA dioxygenase (PhyH)